MSKSANSPRRMIMVLSLLLTFVIGIALVVISLNRPEPWKRTLNVLGEFLAISVAISFLYRVTLRPHDDAAQRAELREILDEKIDQTLAGCNRYGLKGFHGEMNFSQLFNDLDKGDELWWLDTYAPNYLGFVRHLRNALRRGAKIRMLVLNPECKNAEYRADEIGGLFKPTSFKVELRKFWGDMDSCANEAQEGGSLELRWYEGLPCMPMYIIHRNGKILYAYTSFFLGQPTGIEFPHIKWEEGLMARNFLDYVQSKWKANEQNSNLPQTDQNNIADAKLPVQSM